MKILYFVDDQNTFLSFLFFRTLLEDHPGMIDKSGDTTAVLEDDLIEVVALVTNK